MVVYGISYKLLHPEKNGTKTYDKFQITFAYVESDGEEGFARLPRTWEFSYRPAEGFMLERLGASETRGLFGGVENQRQKMYSEACERAIGEVLTVTLCEILDGNKVDGDVSVIVFGPALPKVVGRFASLRPPSNVNIMWVCPKPFPEWIAERANEVLLVPSYAPPTTAGEGWEDEALVVGSEYTPEDGALPCVVQYLSMWGMPAPIDMRKYVWAEARFAESMNGPTTPRARKTTKTSRTARSTRVLLPREIPVAAGTVQNHLADPYQGDSEESWRALQPVFEPGPYDVEVHKHKSSPHSPLPGFRIRWVRKN